MPERKHTLSLELRGVSAGPVENGVEHLTLETDAGNVIARFHPGDGDAAVVWVGGAGGGLDGRPAGCTHAWLRDS